MCVNYEHEDNPEHRSDHVTLNLSPLAHLHGSLSENFGIKMNPTPDKDQAPSWGPQLDSDRTSCVDASRA